LSRHSPAFLFSSKETGAGFYTKIDKKGTRVRKTGTIRAHTSAKQGLTGNSRGAVDMQTFAPSCFLMVRASLIMPAVTNGNVLVMLEGVSFLNSPFVLFQ